MTKRSNYLYSAFYVCGGHFEFLIPARSASDCPIPKGGVKYLVRLSNHLTDVHGLDYINRRKWLQEAKLQPKVRVMIYPAKRSQGLRPTTSETPLSVQEEEQDTIGSFLPTSARGSTW